MTKQHIAAPPTEPLHSPNAHLLCWKSIVAGLLISIMSYMLLASLGAGVLGMAAQSAIENEQGGSALATGTGLWMGLSAVISLFLGSYFAVRISKSVTNKVGAAHGFVVGSIFFLLFAIEAGNAVGSVARGFGNLLNGVGQSTSILASSPLVQDIVDRAVANNNLKSDPKTVAEGLVARLIQGDVESAKAYYAYQTGLSSTEVDSKMAQLKTDFDQTAKVVGEKTARATADIGWSLFITFLVGLIGALMGGRVGAHANLDRPLMMERANERDISYRGTPVLANERGSMLPYVAGWLLGVPASILFLIFLLRTVF